jgi:hypothetical protein
LSLIRLIDASKNFVDFKFIFLFKPIAKPIYEEPIDPCVPSPCGPYSKCLVVGGNRAACSCLQSYIGTPPNCRPECTLDFDCLSNLACMSSRCQDPCVNFCGTNAKCSVLNHKPICMCVEGYTGDPYSACHYFVESKTFSLNWREEDIFIPTTIEIKLFFN